MQKTNFHPRANLPHCNAAGVRHAMFLIWSGLGFVIPLSLFACVTILEAACSEAITKGHNWPYAVSCVFTGLIAKAVANWRVKQPNKRLQDPATGQTIIVLRNDALFFIPVKYWTPILMVAAILLMANP